MGLLSKYFFCVCLFLQKASICFHGSTKRALHYSGSGGPQQWKELSMVMVEMETKINPRDVLGPCVLHTGPH